MKQYLDLLQHIMTNGVNKSDRTGVGTRSVFGYQMRFDLTDGFPLVTTKRVPFRLVVSELLWFLRGDSNIRYLLAHNNHIWDEWAFQRWVNSDEYNGPDMTNFGLKAVQDDAFNQQYQQLKAEFCQRLLDDDAFAETYGELGNIYGKQWRHWKTRDGKEIDQVQQLIHDIRHNPDSRRLILTAWNPEDVPSMALPPCHTMSQFYVVDGKLSCQLYQRSADVFLGVPFNIASYALLTHLIANETGLNVGDFIHTFGDAHVYQNHFEQVETQLQRTPHPLPTLKLKTKPSLYDYEVEDIQIEGYHPDSRLSAPVAV